MKVLTLTTALLLLTGQSVFADTKNNSTAWNKIISVNSSDYYINSKSVKMVSDAPIIIEALVKQKAHSESGKVKAGETLVTKVSFNCDNDTYQLGVSSKYNSAQKLVSQTKEKDLDASYIEVGNSKSYGPLYKKVCSNAEKLSESFEPLPIEGDYSHEGI